MNTKHVSKGGICQFFEVCAQISCANFGLKIRPINPFDDLGKVGSLHSFLATSQFPKFQRNIPKDSVISGTFQPLSSRWNRELLGEGFVFGTYCKSFFNPGSQSFREPGWVLLTSIRLILHSSVFQQASRNRSIYHGQEPDPAVYYWWGDVTWLSKRTFENSDYRRVLSHWESLHSFRDFLH